MMAGLFFLFIFVWIFACARQQKLALIFGLINLVFAALVLLHHATTTLQIRL